MKRVVLCLLSAILFFAGCATKIEGVQDTTFAEFTAEGNETFFKTAGKFQATWGHVSHPTTEALVAKTETRIILITPPHCAPLYIYDENKKEATFFYTNEPDKFLFLRDLPEGTKINVTAYAKERTITVGMVYLFPVTQKLTDYMIMDIEVIDNPVQDTKVLNTDFKTLFFDVIPNLCSYIDTEINFDGVYMHSGKNPNMEGRWITVVSDMRTSLNKIDVKIDVETEKLLFDKPSGTKVRLSCTVDRVDGGRSVYEDETLSRYVNSSYLTKHPIYASSCILQLKSLEVIE